MALKTSVHIILAKVRHMDKGDMMAGSQVLSWGDYTTSHKPQEACVILSQQGVASIWNFREAEFKKAYVAYMSHS